MALAEFDHESMELVVVLNAIAEIVFCKRVECQLLNFSIASLSMNKIVARRESA